MDEAIASVAASAGGPDNEPVFIVDETPAEIRERIETELVEQGFAVDWLSDRTGIAVGRSQRATITVQPDADAAWHKGRPAYPQAPARAVAVMIEVASTEL